MVNLQPNDFAFEEAIKFVLSSSVNATKKSAKPTLASSNVSLSSPSPFKTTVFSSKSAASIALSFDFSITLTFIPSFFLFSNILATFNPIEPIPRITIDFPIKLFLSKISMVRSRSFLSLKI